MRRYLAPVLAVAASALLLAACASTSSADPSSSPSSPPSSTPSAPPAADPQLVVGLDGIALTDDSGSTEASYDDSAALLALLEQATGTLPEPEALEGMEGYDMQLDAYRWDGLQVTAPHSGEGQAWIRVTGADVDGVALETEEGLAVGSARAELIDAGAWALVDTEDPATASELGLGGREVPDTQSLTRPGSVGIRFVMFSLEDDTVTQLMVPADDFSDL